MRRDADHYFKKEKKGGKVSHMPRIVVHSRLAVITDHRSQIIDGGGGGQWWFRGTDTYFLGASGLLPGGPLTPGALLNP